MGSVAIAANGRFQLAVSLHWRTVYRLLVLLQLLVVATAANLRAIDTKIIATIAGQRQDFVRPVAVPTTGSGFAWVFFAGGSVDGR